MWKKMLKTCVKPQYPLKPEFLDLDAKPKDPYAEMEADPHRYESFTLGDFTLDQENYTKKHYWENEKIGRYPHGFRHLENFANYSQVKRDATI